MPQAISQDKDQSRTFSTSPSIFSSFHYLLVHSNIARASHDARGRAKIARLSITPVGHATRTSSFAAYMKGTFANTAPTPSRMLFHEQSKSYTTMKDTQYSRITLSYMAVASRVTNMFLGEHELTRVTGTANT